MQVLIAREPHPRMLQAVVAAALAATNRSGHTLGAAKARVITLTARDSSYDPAVLTLASGQHVRLTLVNAESLDHDTTIPGLNATDAIIEPIDEGGGDHHMLGKMAPGTVHLAALSGARVPVEFIPRAGVFNLYCSVPGHREAGMTGTIVVK